MRRREPEPPVFIRIRALGVSDLGNLARPLDPDAPIHNAVAEIRSPDVPSERLMLVCLDPRLRAERYGRRPGPASFWSAGWQMTCPVHTQSPGRGDVPDGTPGMPASTAGGRLRSAGSPEAEPGCCGPGPEF